MNGYWWLALASMFVAFHYAMRFGTAAVERRTGRVSQPDQRSNCYDLAFFVPCFAIGFAPIYFWSDADPLVDGCFLMLGILVGTLTSQAMYGRKHA